MIIYLKRLFFKMLGKTPLSMEMVQYWKKNEAVQAKVMRKNGTLVMQMQGEKYIFPGFPRGYLLFGKLSKLKHELKNQVFNESWRMLDQGRTPKEIALYIKHMAMPSVYAILEEHRYDMVPVQRMVPAVKEIYESWTRAGGSPQLRDLITYIFQEDDSYRFRFQWMVSYMNPRLMGVLSPAKLLDKGLVWMENAEVIGDMKERVRLIRRVLLALLEDEDNKKFFTKWCREVNWKKVALSKADKFFFRGKYFKVDLDKFDY